MECHEFWEIADSYLSDELTVESNHEAIAHLDKCVKCRTELSARQAVRNKLRDAFISLPVNRVRPEFMNGLSTSLRDTAIGGAERSERSRRYSLLAIAACLLVALLLGGIIVRQQLFRSHDSVKTDLAKAAAGDHRDCAVQFRLAEKPIKLEVAAQKYDPVYLGLTESIITQGGAEPFGIEFVEAHSCVFEGRRFAHVVLKYRGSLVSVLVTGIPAGGEIRLGYPAPLQEPATIVCSQVDTYNVSSFQTTRHAIFVVSALPEGDNLALTRALAPRIFEHIRDRERLTESSASLLKTLLA